MVDMNIIEFIWRNCYQIVAWEKEKSEDNFPSIFGCGFFIKNDDDDFIFVTADHVIHYNDYQVGERTSQEYEYALVNNITCDNLSTQLTTVSAFYSYECYELENYLNGEEELEVAMIPDLKDFAFTCLGKKLPLCFYTHELSLDGNVLCSKGLEKLYISNEAFAKPDTNKEYIVLGTLGNNLTNGIRWERCNAIHCGLRYEGEEDGMYKFHYNNVRENEWEGLSGSPFFSGDGELIGMLVRAVPDFDRVLVIPIDRIINFINMVKGIEEKK